MSNDTPEAAELLAQNFHETYERLAPEHGYDTRKASAVPWVDVPANNRALMVATCAELIGPARALGWLHTDEIAVPVDLAGRAVALAQAAKAYPDAPEAAEALYVAAPFGDLLAGHQLAEDARNREGAGESTGQTPEQPEDQSGADQ